MRAHRGQVDHWPGLIIDVTEEQIVTDLALATEMTKKLAPLNVKLAIDDFGRGYSSLARLKELPFAELKLDRTFVTDCGTDKVNAPLCKTVIDLAHNFGSAAVAIGIEKASDALALTSMGCDLGQGFLLGQPMPEERFMSLLRQRAAGQGQPMPAAAALPRCARQPRSPPSVRPGVAALEGEIVGIGDGRGAPAPSPRTPDRRCRGARNRRSPPPRVSKRSRTCWRMSPELVQPISGSISRGCSGS